MSATRELAKPLVLADGQVLDRESFHEIYAATSEDTRAELIGGVVYMASPLSYDHGDDNAPVVYWLACYVRHTPGLRISVNASILLDDYGETQPDVSLRILPEFGGRVRHKEGFIVGAPEFLIEIARSSLRVDLGPKKDDYERAGAFEYAVVDLLDRQIHWFARRGAKLERARARADGCYHSESFPGLILDPEALFASDYAALDAAVVRGVATPEHAEFARRLVERRN